MTKIITFLNDSSYNNGRNNSNQFNAYMVKIEPNKLKMVSFSLHPRGLILDDSFGSGSIFSGH